MTFITYLIAEITLFGLVFLGVFLAVKDQNKKKTRSRDRHKSEKIIYLDDYRPGAEKSVKKKPTGTDTTRKH